MYSSLPARARPRSRGQTLPPPPARSRPAPSPSISIGQHRSAYVSIRQHTSAGVSMRKTRALLPPACACSPPPPPPSPPPPPPSPSPFACPPCVSMCTFEPVKQQLLYFCGRKASFFLCFVRAYTSLPSCKFAPLCATGSVRPHTVVAQGSCTSRLRPHTLVA
jgi:hypothetical protein